ncbi:transposase [Chryseobacterium nematophagum]|uniref:Transposase n=1 Tax=Chryseobacterium nematophagum TaxID=2305228 RepID=A0A3M7TB00_9FLAO|nr:transposase [Chryseobacterium nematophagum]RNA60483.1 transposase [Chryseobacterium nematophagum]RNA63972.1 transposase [Chryseobacterium nematophagum]RNA63996.1 transposase [Chryseobacterium nematophagum]
MLGKKFNFKQIHVGSLVQQKVKENGLEISQICACFGKKEEDITQMYVSETLDTDILLTWSKLLDYNFFRIYSEHLILYSPPSQAYNKGGKKIIYPYHRKNIYTRGMIDFILEELDSGEKSMQQVKQEYGIPKSTLHKWIDKYKI